MAYIQCINKKNTSLTVELWDLDKTWDGGNRTIYWYCMESISGIEPWDVVWDEDVTYNNYSTIL